MQSTRVRNRTASAAQHGKEAQARQCHLESARRKRYPGGTGLASKFTYSTKSHIQQFHYLGLGHSGKGVSGKATAHWCLDECTQTLGTTSTPWYGPLIAVGFGVRRPLYDVIP